MPASAFCARMCIAWAFSLVLSISVSGCAPGLSDPRDYSSLATNLSAVGHLRLDTDPADAPYSRADLIDRFEDIVFRYEFHFKDGKIVQEPLDKPLKRWRGHIRYMLVGDAVTSEDIAEVADLTRRLAGLTGLSFGQVTDGPHDMLISIASPRGRQAISAELAEAGLNVYRERYDIWRRTPGWICGATLSSDRKEPGRLVRAHVFIGSEVTGILRRGCLHEEIVQSLGLTNDSDAARPSIFNDDQEFLLLTRHDETLLRALYSPLLRPGMSSEEARPLLAAVFEDLHRTH